MPLVPLVLQDGIFYYFDEYFASFCYSGHVKRALHDPAVPPKLNLSKEEYKQHKATGMQYCVLHVQLAINHFYEKLFKLKDLIKTESGKKIATTRHAFMEEYVKQFTMEWEAGDAK